MKAVLFGDKSSTDNVLNGPGGDNTSQESAKLPERLTPAACSCREASKPQPQTGNDG
jgi:hypothetical protein